MTVLPFKPVKKGKADDKPQKLMPRSVFEHQQEITVSFRGSLAEKADAINCKSERDGLLLNLIQDNFRGCIAYWECPGSLVVGRFEDVGEYYPDW